MILQSGWSNFNTSHVNVNPDLPVMGGERRIISIHLMLMLICSIEPYTTGEVLFQYISC